MVETVCDGRTGCDIPPDSWTARVSRHRGGVSQGPRKTSGVRGFSRTDAETAAKILEVSKVGQP